MNTNTEYTDSSEKKLNKNLGFLGVDFQYKLMKYLMENPQSFVSIKDQIEAGMFTDSKLRFVVDKLKQYYDRYSEAPTYESISTFGQQTKDESDVMKEVMDKVQVLDIAKDIKYIKDRAFSFFKQQALVKTLSVVAGIVERGETDKYDSCPKMFEDAIRKTSFGEKEDFHPFDDVEKTLSGEMRKPIPTGILSLDGILNGGIGKGELGLICGPSGFGKTTITTSMASYAACCKNASNKYQGYKVLQIIFEDSKTQISTKYIARELGIECSKVPLYNKIEKNAAKQIKNSERYKMQQNNIMIRKLHDGEKTASDIDNIIRNDYINNGFVPDLVLLDYFECLKAEHGTMALGQHLSEAHTMRKLETMAAKLNVGLWVTTQGTKDSYGSKEFGGPDKISGSASKYNICHMCLIISRSMDDFSTNVSSIKITKNRAGNAGVVISNVYFDNGKCRISSEGEGHVQGYEDTMSVENDRNLAIFNAIKNGVTMENESIETNPALEFVNSGVTENMNTNSGYTETANSSGYAEPDESVNSPMEKNKDFPLDCPF